MAQPKSRKNPNISRETHTILACPNSTLYLLDRRETNILWSFDLNIKVCEAFHDKNVASYIDAKTNDKGDMQLYLCSSSNSSSDMIDWDKTPEALKRYVTENFVDAEVVFDDLHSQVKLDRWGQKVDSSSNNYHYRIDCSHYVISHHKCSSKWHLHFTTYVVSYCGNHDSIELPVLHNCDEVEFIKRCQEIKDYKFSKGVLEDVSLEDICLKYELKRKNISKSEETIRGRVDVIKGKYMTLDPAIKKMPMAGVARKKKNIISTNLHDNILRWFGGENDDLLFAYEFCPFNLYQFLNDGFRNDEIMAILRGVISGVHHLHQLKLAHGNITPWTMLVSSKHVPKLGGIEGCKTLSPNLKDENKVSLGYLIAYCLSSAEYINKITEEQYNRSDPLEQGLDKARESDAYHLAWSLVYDVRQHKPTLPIALADLCFWIPSKKLQFVKDANNVLHEQDSNSTLRKKKEIDIHSISSSFSKKNSISL